MSDRIAHWLFDERPSRRFDAIGPASLAALACVYSNPVDVAGTLVFLWLAHKALDA